MHEEDVNALEPQEITSLNEAAGKRSRFTCPECSGLLWEIREGELVKLRCRVGHAYTEQGFLAEHGKTLEAALWTAATALEEKADFCRRVASRFEAGGQEITARRYRDQADNALAQGELVRRAIENLLAPPLDEEQAAS